MLGMPGAEDAAQWLDWHPRDLERVAAEQGITAGRFGRWARTDIARLDGDEDLMEQVRIPIAELVSYISDKIAF